MLIHKLAKQMHLGNLDVLLGCKNAPPIPILCFTDDCMIFCKTNRKSINALESCLCTYERMAGQGVCWKKNLGCFFLQIHLRSQKQLLLHSLGVIGNQRLDKYLGLPFIMGSSKKDLFYIYTPSIP